MVEIECASSSVLEAQHIGNRREHCTQRKSLRRERVKAMDCQSTIVTKERESLCIGSSADYTGRQRVYLEIPFRHNEDWFNSVSRRLLSLAELKLCSCLTYIGILYLAVEPTLAGLSSDPSSPFVHERGGGAPDLQGCIGCYTPMYQSRMKSGVAEAKVEFRHALEDEGPEYIKDHGP